MMLATQVLPDSDFEVNLENNCETDVVGFLTVENKEHAIKKGENKIGRDPSICSIVLENFTVSKLHAIIESDGVDETFVYDVGSTNQTKLGKKCLKAHCRYKVDDKAILTFGNVVAEFKVQGEIGVNRGSVLDTTPPSSGDKNKSDFEGEDDIFELSTQINFLQPSTSGERKTFRKSLEETHIFKVPYQKILESQKKTSPEPSQNYFDAETQCQLSVPEFSPKENSFNDGTNSNIFCLNTQCQITQPFSQRLGNNVLPEGKKNDNEDLLNDGHDDVLSSVSLHSPGENFEKCEMNATDCNKKECDLVFEKEKQFENQTTDENINKEDHNLKSSLGDSFLDITIDDLESLNNDNINFLNVKKECLSQVVENIKTENVEEVPKLELETNWELNENLDKEQPLVIQESSDEETQIYSNELLNASERNEEILERKTFDECDGISKNSGSERNKEVNECDRINKNSQLFQNEDFVSTQTFDIGNEKEKSNENDNENDADDTIMDENEDFLATQLFSGPVNNYEKTSKNVQNTTALEGIEDCEDFLATQLFSGPVNNFEKSKPKQNECNRTLNSVEDINDSEDMLETQLFAEPINHFENKKLDKVKEISATENTSNLTIENENENSEDFVATQIFTESINNHTKEKQNTARVEENEDLLETQIFPINNIPQEKEKDIFENSNTVRKSKNSEDLVATQIFAQPLNNQTKEKQSFPNPENTITAEEDEDMLETQIFSVNNNPQEKEKDIFKTSKSLNAGRESENCEDFVATQIFEPSTSNNEPRIREGSPDLLSSDTADCSQDFIGTQIFREENPVFPEHEKNIERINIKEEKLSKSHVSDSSGDETESDLEIITEKINTFPEKHSSPPPCVNKTPSEEKSIDDIDNNSNSSYVFEVEMQNNSEIESNFHIKKEESDVENTNISRKNGKSKTNSFWECLSLEMPCTQDVEKTLTKAPSETFPKLKKGNDKINLTENKINKRSWKSDCESSEVPSKKSKIYSNNEEKRLSRLWRAHDITEIRTSRTRCCDKTPQTMKTSRRIRQEVQETPTPEKESAANCSKRSHSPQIESDFSSCRRVLRSSKCLKYESPIPVEKSSTSSSHKSVPSRKLRKTSRRRSKKWSLSDSCVNIIFTGFECDLLDKIINELKGKKNDVLCLSDVVVTDKVRRTVKFLCAIGLGLPIVSPEWLLSSKKEKEFLDPWDFILKDEKSEEKWDFNLMTSLIRSKKSKLLKGLNVFATRSTKPPPKDLLAIVESCGGTPITSQPEIWPKKTIIASCTEDEESWPNTKTSHVQIVHYECILSGVLRQKLDLRTFKLK